MLRFTLYGLLMYDPTLFDGIDVPNGMDPQDIVDEIIERSGDLYLYYQVPARVKHQIHHWFKIRKPEFQRMLDAFASDYNPIENYDRREDSVEAPNMVESVDQETRGSSSGSSDTSGMAAKSAYNGDAMTPTDSTTGKANRYDSTDARNSSSKQTYGTTTRTSRIHGNIGVTTNQQMIEAELQLRKKNIYEIITAEFEKQFLIQVY